MTTSQPGTSSTCEICKEVIAVPAFEPREGIAIIDLDKQWQAELAHHEEKHPDSPKPERWL